MDDYQEPPYDAAWASSPADAWRHRATHRLSERPYAVVVGALILVGYLCAGLGVWLSHGVGTSWYFMLLGFLGIGAGFELTERLPDWRLSLVGHLLSNAGIGVLVSPLILMPEMALLRNTAVLVFLGTALLLLGAAIHPKTVKAFGSFLGAGLVSGALGLMIGGMWAPHIGAPEPGFAAAGLAAIYLAYVDYYWTQALKLPRSMDNAVDAAAALEIGLVNRALTRFERSAREKHPG